MKAPLATSYCRQPAEPMPTHAEPVSDNFDRQEVQSKFDPRIAEQRRVFAGPRPFVSPLQFSQRSSSYLDFVRVLATNLVLVSHASVIFEWRRVNTASLGVVLFFLLSGFLITVVGQRRARRSEKQFGAFMADRCARIFVPFLPCLIAVALINSLLSLGSYGQQGVNRGPIALFANAFLLNDYPLLQALSHRMDVTDIYPRSYNTAEPFWTIPIEFWTYVIFGLFVFQFVRGERISVFVTISLLIIAAPVFLWNAFAGGGGLLSLVWVLGALFGYLWASGLDGRSSNDRLGILMVGIGAIGIIGRILKVGYDAYELQQDVFIALVVFGIFLVLDGNRRNAGMLGRFFAVLASYSYSLYLVHNTVLILFREKFDLALGPATPIAALIAAHAVAYCFYFAFERHYHVVGSWLKKQLDLGR